MTLIAPAALELSAPVNLRDLGGLPVAGGTVRPGFALRADDLSLVTDDVADRFVSDGLRTVIDLRSADEVAVTGRGPLGTRRSVNYHHLPLMADIGQAKDAEALPDQSAFGGMYLRMVEQAAGQLVAALAVIAHSPGTTAFHCAAGQDRTGVLAATLLLALGAERETIVADYARTGENSAAIMVRIRPLITPLMQRYGLDIDGAARAAVRTEFSAQPMRELVSTLTARYGDPLAPLRQAGLSDALVERLHERGVVS